MKVPNDRLRAHVQAVMRDEPELTFYEIAYRAGYTRMKRGHRRADPTSVLRALGLANTPCLKRGRRYSYLNTHCTYDTALRIARAVNADPFEVGL